MSKKSVVLLVVAIVLVLVIGVWGVWKLFVAPPAFYAVQLSTGEMYFGTLTHFPYGLKDVYLLTQTGDSERPVNVQRFVNSLIGPRDYLRINKDQVVWSTRLNNQGQLAQVLISGTAPSGETTPPASTMPEGGTTPPVSQ